MATLANAENDALVNKLAHSLAEVEVETLREGQGKKKAEAQVGTLAEKVTEWQVNIWRLTVRGREGRPTETLAYRLLEEEVHTLGQTLDELKT